jgi:hypothetical protein
MQISNAASSIAGNSSAASSNAASYNSNTSTGPSFQTLLGQLTNYVNESPEQRMAASILAQLGITPQQLAAMSPADREKVEAKVRDLMKKEIQAQQQQQQQQVQAQTQKIQASALQATTTDSSSSQQHQKSTNVII